MPTPNAAILACYRQSPLQMDELVNGEVWTNIGGLYRLLVEEVTAGHEILYGYEWLDSVLSADATLLADAPGGVWRALAPPSSAVPYVIMQHQSGSDVTTMNAFRLMSDLLFQIKIVGPASNTAGLVAGAARIDQLLGSPPTSGTI